VFGFIALEVADEHDPGPLPPEPDRMAIRERALSATPADRFPRSAAAAATMAGYISTGQYVWGLRRVLDGITARSAASPQSEGDVVAAEDVDLSNRQAR
jgi:TetR/AcrR family transcriptional regulator, tetracycline repressor protein